MGRVEYFSNSLAQERAAPRVAVTAVSLPGRAVAPGGFDPRRVIAAAIAILFSALQVIANADEPSLASPDKRYLIRLHHKPDAIYPVVILRDTRSGHESQIFDYDSVGQGAIGLDALWSPDSRYVVLGIAVSPSKHAVKVYRIDQGVVREVEILPVPKALDTRTKSDRGGPFTDRWEDNRTLWIGDSTKYRVFRYRVTKDGKLKADAFKEESQN